MSLLELIILAVGLSMDAFAVSVCKGLALGEIKKKHALIAGAWFGGGLSFLQISSRHSQS